MGLVRARDTIGDLKRMHYRRMRKTAPLASWHTRRSIGYSSMVFEIPQFDESWHCIQWRYVLDQQIVMRRDLTAVDGPSLVFEVGAREL